MLLTIASAGWGVASPALACLSTRPDTVPPMSRCCSIVELRQYTLHPRQRDVLVELFEKEFVEPQRAAGARVIGQFLDLDDPDRFVWLRGFDSMAARAISLATFYEGPVWKANRQAANATMLDSDNVLLLRPAGPDRGFELADPRRNAGVVTAMIHYVAPQLLPGFVSFFDARLRLMAQEWGVDVLASLVSEDSPNTFPRLPIRTGESVFVWFARFDDEPAQQSFGERFRSASGWREAAPETLLPAFMRKPEVLRLRPSRGSSLR
ncbi:MAG: NIPSNAP family protein [Pseudomonadota bacterium]|nr:NIPSNAP family protein [Pseudomonadota bacterium]